jgi:hypothetical protein
MQQQDRRALNLEWIVLSAARNEGSVSSLHLDVLESKSSKRASER